MAEHPFVQITAPNAQLEAQRLQASMLKTLCDAGMDPDKAFEKVRSMQPADLESSRPNAQACVPLQDSTNAVQGAPQTYTELLFDS